MNKIINQFLLAGDEFMPEMHLKQPGFTYSDCGPFTKNKKRIKRIKETGDSRYIHFYLDNIYIYIYIHIYIYNIYIYI